MNAFWDAQIMDIMEARIVKLELVTEKILERLTAVERDVAVIRSNYATKADLTALQATLEAKLEAKLDAASANYATKADLLALEARLEARLAAFETTIIKWFVGTAVTLSGLSFAAAKLIA
ncbi:hypothetical protein INH39_23160 [Massilia violaceinigra]|uniref:DUF1640 domain-containing protein n=1 Tax=Massilia violaceinigra TaxID=2045208 RepID=A0ABY4A131_9BURK|nr:hypothetical protein [Massilia violaceinigra]UOD28332.1 hypothetical protein INH39_23160 [Massilia violaceinigra]